MITRTSSRMSLAGFLVLSALPLGCGSSGAGNNPEGAGATSGSAGGGGSGMSGGAGTGGSGGAAMTGGSGGGMTSGTGGGGAGSGGTGGSGGSMTTGGSDAGSGMMSGKVDAGGSADGGSDMGGAPAPMGGFSIVGLVNATTPLKPFVNGIWIGKPGYPPEAAAGPVVYLFTAKPDGSSVTCADISKKTVWTTSIPMGVQIFELIIGTHNPGTKLPWSFYSGVNKVEVQFALGGVAGETTATGGSVTLLNYKTNMYVDGTIDVTLPSGKAAGAWRAEWCPNGLEF